MKKYYYILLIVVLSAIAGSVIYWRSQRQIVLPEKQPIADKINSEVDTSDWIKYENTKSGFEVKYPNSWKEEQGALYSPVMYNGREDGPYSLHISIKSDFKNIDELLNSQSRCVKDIVRFIINNRDAARYIDICGYQSPKITIVRVNDILVEGVSYSVSDESDIINQILSTFKFLDATQVSTADWKAFDQEKEGVRNDVLSNFRFPKSWYTFNLSGGSFTEINFSDGGNLVNQDLDNQTITNRLYELHKAQENECRLTVGASSEDKKYNITKYNSKVDDNSRGICDIILTTLQKQIPSQY